MIIDDYEMTRKVTDYLNKLYSLDRKCMNELLWARVPCNNDIVEKSEAVPFLVDGSEQHYLGFLGIINGMLKYKVCAMILDTDGSLQGFVPEQIREIDLE